VWDIHSSVTSKTFFKSRALLGFSFALAYAFAGWAGLALAIPPGYASPVFPAAGLALACVLWFGPQVLAGVWLGSVVLDLSLPWRSGMLTQSTAVLALVIATGATLQAWVGSWLVRRRRGPAWQTLEQEHEVLVFLLLGGVLPGVISSFTGATALQAFGIIEGAEFPFTAWNWYVGDVLGVLVFAPLTLCLLHRKGGLWRDRRRRIVMPMLLTLGLVALAFYATARWERQAQDIQLGTDSEIVFKRIADRVIAHREVLSSLKRFIDVTPDFSFKQFEMFTRITLQDNPDIFALSFNDLIADEKRPAFESRMSGLSPLGSFQITERDAAGKLIRAMTRPEYVVVRYIVPLANNQPAVGYDIYSEAVRRDTINRARASGAMAVTAPIRLVQEQKPRVGVLGLLPVTRAPGAPTNEQAPRLLGFAVAVVKVDEMIDIATRGHVPAGLVFQMVDPHAPEGQGLLYDSGNPTAGTIAPARAAQWKTTVRMGDRDWELSVHTSEEYLRQHRSWMAWAAGVAGLLFAALLQILMLGMTGRTSMQERAKETLAHSHDLMRYIIEHANSAVAVHDRDLRYIYVSQRYLDEYKVKERDVIGKHHYDVFPDLPQKWRDVHQRALAGEVSSADRDPYHRADGTLEWTRWECRPWYEAGGAIGGIIVYTEVITERVRAEEALRESEQRLSQALRAARAGAWAWNIQTNQAFWSPENFFILGLVPDRAETTYDTWLQCVHPDDRAQAARDVALAVEGRMDLNIEFRVVWPDGSLHWINDVGKLLLDGAGQPIGMYGIQLDITDRKKVEQALFESEQRFRTLAEASWEGLAITEGGVLVDCSDQMARLCGRDRAELIGKSALDFIAPEHRDLVAEAQRSGRLEPYEHLMLRADGTRFLVEVRGRQAQIGGRQVRIVAVRDITERKQAEEALRSSLAEKESLLRELHHRVKNNLQVISSLLGLQLRQVNNAEMQSFLRDTQNRIRSMAMLHEILYHSRTVASISLPPYVKSLCDHLARSYGSAAPNIRLTRRVADVALNLDQAITAGLIVNELVTNAMKHAFPFRSDGEIVVELQAHDEHRLVLRVSDNGVGLPAEASPDGSKTLGLLLVSNLSRQLDGQLSVKSGSGAVFEIVFPRKPLEG
jgi:PAS domain S-box-containing protein